MLAVVALAVLMIFGTGIIAVISEHMQKMAKIKAEAQSAAGQDVLGAIEALRGEVRDLRDTTTKYDLSFDTALQRLESRVAHLEARATAQPQPAESIQSAVAR